jgi:hypothetical protein
MCDSKRSSLNNAIRVAMAVVTALCWAAVSVKTADAQVTPPPVFSAANIVFGETLRVNIVNLGDPTIPPGPCNVQITFVNTNSQTVKTSNVSTNVGQIGWATVNFLEATQAKVTATADSPLRQVLRPVITVFPPDPCRVVMSAEVYDTVTGRTSQYITVQNSFVENPTTLATN